MLEPMIAWCRQHKPLLVSFCKYGLGIGLLVWVICSNWHPAPGHEHGGIADILTRPLRLTPLLIACTLYVASVVLTFIRWYVLVRAQGLPFPMRDAVRLGLVGLFMNTLTPAGDVFKAAFIAREQTRRTAAVASVMMDRSIGLFGLIALTALLGSLFWLGGHEAMNSQRGLQAMVLALSGVVLLVGLAWLLVGVLSRWQAARLADRLEGIPKCGHAAAELWRSLLMYRQQGGSVALALGLAMAGHVGFILTYFCVSQMFVTVDARAAVPSLGENFLVVPVGLICQSGVPTPGRVGGGEYVFGKLYELIGKSADLGVLISLGARLITIAAGMMGYVLYLLMKPASAVAPADVLRQAA